MIDYALSWMLKKIVPSPTTPPLIFVDEPFFVHHANNASSCVQIRSDQQDQRENESRIQKINLYIFQTVKIPLMLAQYVY